MGTKKTKVSQRAEDKSTMRDKRAATRAAKLDANAKRLDDFFEDNSVKGDDFLQQLRQANPSLSPKQMNPVLENAFIEAYCDAGSDRQKQNAIETYALTSIALHGVSDYEVIRNTITQMEKAIKSIAFTKAKVIAKKLALPAIEVAVYLISKKAMPGSPLSKLANAATVAVPMFKLSDNGKKNKSESDVRQDEIQAYKAIERVRSTLGRLPKTWS
jgi:hypothetical protein